MGDDNYSPLLHSKDNNNNYDMNTKILLSAIISLSLVVILVIILHIYARCLIRRQARRESALRRLSFIISAHRASIDPRNAGGLSPSIIASLPIHVHKREESTANDDEDEMGLSSSMKECSVCLSMYEDGEMVRTLPNCKHSFHAECIDMWFGSNSTCPVCRMEAEPYPAAAVEASAGVPPSAPPLEGTSGGVGGGGDHKVGRSMSSRLSYSFRRMLSRERSSRRMQTTQSCCDLENGAVVTDHDQRQ